MTERFMLEAIRIARENIRRGHGGPFGAVVVKEGQVIGRGGNCVTSRNDPTAHAEVEAIRNACGFLGHFHLRGCELYTLCEPCPMCLGAIYWARVERVYYAADRKDAAAVGFDDDWIYEELGKPGEERNLKMEQTLREEALPVFDEWYRMEDKIPY